MTNVGIDLHKTTSVVCLLTDRGEQRTRSIPTTVCGLSRMFARRKRCRILVEASTESEWVARHLERFGHQVIVGDPNFKPMYSYRDPHVKTDRRDAEALALACREGLYRPAHRRSDARTEELRELGVRRHLIETRTKLISYVRAVLRQQGIKPPKARPETVARKLREHTPDELLASLEPLLCTLEHLQQQITRLQRQLERRCAEQPELAQLQTAPGVGPVTVATLVAVWDTPGRFAHASGVARYLGLTPKERSSSERRRLGRITQAGPSEARRVLVQAAWCVWRSRDPRAQALKTWVHALARRRGKKVAVTALARRLARILWAMWRDQQPFDPRRHAVHA